MTAERRRRLPSALTSARLRIAAAVVVLLVLAEGASLATARQILLARTAERVDDSLVQEVREFRLLVDRGRNPLTGKPFGTDVQAMFEVFLQRNVPGQNEAIYTFLDGRPFRSTVAEDAPSADLRRLPLVREPTRGEVRTSTGPVAYLAVPVAVGGARRGTFVVTSDLAGERAEVTEALETTAGVSLAVLAVASLLAFAVAGRVLAPLRQMTDTARAISETDLTRRIDVRGDDEIAGLGRTFNAMLDRLETAFGSQRAFVSDAGHELRTPITIIRGHLELLGDDPEERREAIELVTDELDRMARFVDDLLTLAKAERNDFLHLGDLDLDVLTEELVAKAEGLAPRDWRLGAVGTGRLTADRQRLTQAVMNLAGNAVQHTSDGDRIELGSSVEDGCARLWVRDEGPGIAPADQERIFERFARASGDRRRSEGAGLGLAIVRAIAEAHGGRVLLDTRPGAGSTFTVEVPAEPPTADITTTTNDPTEDRP